MKEYILSLVCMACIILSGCTKESQPDDITFNIDIVEAKAYSASVVVTHNATNNDSYYGIVVEGKVKDINEEINKFLESADPETLQEEVLNQRKRKIDLIGLLPERTYTYIVFGMNGQSRFGKPAAIEIQTESHHLEARINPDWNLKYHGHTVYNDIDYSKLTVRVSGEAKERYYLAIFPHDRVKDIESIESVIAMAFSEMQAGNTFDIWFENNEIRTQSTAFYRRLTPGDYIAYVIGIDESCTPTGSYIKSDLFHVDKYPYTPEYENLLGDWYMIDNTDKVYRVTFSEYITNSYVAMTRWGNIDDPQDKIILKFDRNNGSFSLANQLICENHKITFSDGTVIEGKLSIRGTFINADGKHKKVDNNEVFFKLSEEKMYTAVGFNVQGNDGNVYDGGLAYYLEASDKAVWYATMMFPLTMYKFD